MKDNRPRINLRDERERKGLQIEQISQQARIPLRYIEALETGNISAVKKGPQLLAFKKQYLEFLGLPLNAKLRFRTKKKRRPQSKKRSLTRTITTTSTHPLPRPSLLKLMASAFVVIMIMLLSMKMFSSMIDKSNRAAKFQPTKAVDSTPATAKAEKTPAEEKQGTLSSILQAALTTNTAKAATKEVEKKTIPQFSIRAIGHASARIVVDGEVVFPEEGSRSGKLVPGRKQSFDFAHKIELWTNRIDKIDVRHNGDRIIPQGSYNGERRMVFVKNRADL